jgi:hypothetical protein
VSLRDGRARLLSPVFDEEWPVRAPLEARCRAAAGTAAHAAPALACSCGVYAGRDPDAVLVHLVGRDGRDVVHRVLGQVALWGTVVESERGWRGALAYPVLLLVPARRADGSAVELAPLAEALGPYGVPVAALGGPHGSDPLAARLDPARRARKV